MTESLRVVLVDDQDLVRAGFRVILGAEPDMSVVGEAGDGREAVRLVGELRPDVVLMDVQMPEVDGLEATRRILGDQADSPAPTKVVILTTFDREDYLFEALQAGASGFLLKNASPEDLVESVRIVARGDALLSPEVTRRVIARFSAPNAAPLPATRPDVLTEREYEVLVMLARGASNGEIAERFVVSEATVKTHVSRVLTKLDLRDRTHAVVFAYENGIVAPGIA
ncbi:MULTISPECIES: response regulator [Prauserella salsuginis group]|uniref:DNA-binding NarL/FixJ family response regulator n=2 Tax=Prauserella salsuginis group TaxID=2893672 RepID=A0A839XTX1_9PSEU|nr:MULTISPECIES: response regulator transcription factor [Prauserella salsuginis group]MBB3664013.1 DNA-binding NarL/FixJ family response regulator [Prauserella sediminis]MCR3721468.1 two component transcriptional regulator, LuxR family [Prauserella flava]MCR3732458.1 two component transcriptional regulator, LuxR family [Prauserella salsuginis]